MIQGQVLMTEKNIPLRVNYKSDIGTLNHAVISAGATSLQM